MIDLSLLTDGGLGWLDASGPESHLVLSTRIRLARNLAGNAMPSYLAEVTAGSYREFLVDRRRLMAAVIRDHYQAL